MKTTMTPKRVVVIGQGYVGLPLALRAVDMGHHVIGFDLDEHRVRGLRNGVSFIPDATDEEIRAALDSGRFEVSTDSDSCRDFEVAIVAVPTPLRDGAPEMSYVVQAAETLGPRLGRGALVVIESSTYPGTTEDVVRPILERGSGLRAERDFYLGYSPERIDPGNESPFWTIPKIVSGVGADSLQAIDDFYQTVVERTVPVSGPRVAELAKLLENTFRHVNIGLVNEIAMYAGKMGIDVWEAIDAAATKPFGFMRFLPGPGVGGHCLPIDPTYLSWQVMRRLGANLRFVQVANEINAHMPDYVVHRVTEVLNGRQLAVNGARILLLGLAYKPNTGDMRESPAVAVGERLLALGAQVVAVDEFIHDGLTDNTIERVALTPAEVGRADLVILLTDHDNVDYQLVTKEATVVLDTRRRLSGAQVVYL